MSFSHKYLMWSLLLHGAYTSFVHGNIVMVVVLKRKAFHCGVYQLQGVVVGKLVWWWWWVVAEVIYGGVGHGGHLPLVATRGDGRHAAEVTRH